MKVGIITAEVESTSGWAQMSARLIDALRAEGVTVRVAAATGTVDAALATLPKLVEGGRNVLLRQAVALPAARRAFRDCEIVHTLVEPFAPLGVATAGRRPHVMTTAGTYAALPLMRRWPVGALYRQAFERSSVVAISRYTQRVLAGAAPRARSHVIVLGCDAAALRDAAADAEPYAKHGPVVLFVGGVKARKGALQLAQAMVAVRDRHPTATCVIAGSLRAEPDYVARLRAEIDRLGLRDTVLLPGHVKHDDLMRWYRTADVFCVPSMNDGWRFEGFGLVHLEAGAFGLPAIGTRECGAEDAIDDGESGLLVSQAAVDTELPAALLRLLDDEALRKRMGAANQAKAERMTWRAAARQYVDLYTAELNTRR